MCLPCLYESTISLCYRMCAKGELISLSMSPLPFAFFFCHWRGDKALEYPLQQRPDFAAFQLPGNTGFCSRKTQHEIATGLYPQCSSLQPANVPVFQRLREGVGGGGSVRRATRLWDDFNTRIPLTCQNLLT